MRQYMTIIRYMIKYVTIWGEFIYIYIYLVH